MPSERTEQTHAVAPLRRRTPVHEIIQQWQAMRMCVSLESSAFQQSAVQLNTAPSRFTQRQSQFEFAPAQQSQGTKVSETDPIQDEQPNNRTTSCAQEATMETVSFRMSKATKSKGWGALSTTKATATCPTRITKLNTPTCERYCSAEDSNHRAWSGKRHRHRHTRHNGLDWLPLGSSAH